MKKHFLGNFFFLGKNRPKRRVCDASKIGITSVQYLPLASMIMLLSPASDSYIPDIEEIYIFFIYRRNKLQIAGYLPAEHILNKHKSAHGYPLN